MFVLFPHRAFGLEVRNDCHTLGVVFRADNVALTEYGK